MPAPTEEEKTEALESIDRAAALFEDAVRRQDTDPAGAARRNALIDEVRGGLKALKEEVQAGNGRPSDDCDDAGWSLIRHRAYLLGAKEIRLEAQDAITELSGWHLPRSRMRNLEKYLDDAKSNDLEVARAALYRIFDEYDYWDSYTDRFNEDTFQLATGLAIVGVLLLVSSGVLTAFGLMVAGVLVAGAAGSCVSVLSRLPRISTYGTAGSSWQAMIFRVVAGTLASVIGLGFVLLGVLPISITENGGSHTISGLTAQCVAQDRAFGQRLQGEAEAEGAEAQPMLAEADPELPCDGPAKVILLALALLLGFSERMLPRFEEMIAGRSSSPPKDEEGGGAQ